MLSLVIMRLPDVLRSADSRCMTDVFSWLKAHCRAVTPWIGSAFEESSDAINADRLRVSHGALPARRDGHGMSAQEEFADGLIGDA